MKRFNDLLGKKEEEVSVVAVQWCDDQIKNLEEEMWLPWARARFEDEDLLSLDHLKLLRYWATHKKYFTYESFVKQVTRACMAFYRTNGGQATELEQGLFAKMQDGYTPAYYKEHPDLSPDKIQLELEDGIAYISKKSGWVLSQS